MRWILGFLLIALAACDSTATTPTSETLPTDPPPTIIVVNETADAIIETATQIIVEAERQATQTVSSAERQATEIIATAEQAATDVIVESAQTPTPTTDCGIETTFIHVIQGDGHISPLVGETVTVEGIVTGDFETENQLNGFFVQEEPGDSDNDPSTSDGIFVYTRDDLASVGDLVRVSGEVAEFFEATQISKISEVIICQTGQAITPAEIELPFPDADYLEQFEGMLITFPQELTITEHYNLGRYGEVWLSANGRQFKATNFMQPGEAAVELEATYSLNRFILDDGSNKQNPSPTPYLFGDNGLTLRLGDTVQGLTGVLGYSNNSYRLHPIQTPEFNRANPRPLTPHDVGGDLRVASFNVLNYFTTIDSGNALCGPSNLGCRGADSQQEFERQRAKTIAALSAAQADVIGLMEVENNDEAIIDLINGLNAALGAGTYDYIDTGVIGTDAIRIAIIYMPATVTPIGDPLIDMSNVHNRPPVAQTFKHNTSDEVFTVVVNHLRSKRCSENSSTGENANQGDGQECNVAYRTAQSQALLQFINDTIIVSSGDPDVLAIGDFNAYPMETPITLLLDAGMVNLIDTFVENAYSYNFNGQAGYLDHALATASLLPQVTGVTEWHINADEPTILDYNEEFKSDDGILLTEDTIFRASDHDPVIIGLSLQSN